MLDVLDAIAVAERSTARRAPDRIVDAPESVYESALARSGFGWEGAAQALLGSSTAQVRRELEMLAAARRQPLTAFSYCFCEVRQSP